MALKTYTSWIGRAMPTVLSKDAPWGSKFMGTLALFLDAIAHSINQATKAPWQIRDDGVPEDALTHIGDDLLLERYPTETRAQYEARLADPWGTWELAGGPQVILDQLAKAGWPGAVIYSTLEWPTRPPSPWWSQFWVVFPEGTHPVTGPGPTIGSFTVGDGTIIGPVGITAIQLLTIRRIIRKFKSARWVARQIIFEISGWTIGTGHDVGESGLIIGGETAFVGV